MIRSLTLAILTSILCIVGIDGILRWWGVRPVNLRPAIHQASTVPGLEYELRPSMHTFGFRSEKVTTNAEGFRSNAISGDKPIIAILGDSYTFGFGVDDDETNPSIIAKALPMFDVINTGVNGYNIEQEVLTYEAKIAQKNPNIVILEFTPNDGNRKAKFKQDISERMKVKKKWTIRGPRWWLRTSPLVDIVRRGFAQISASTASSDPITAELLESKLTYYRIWFDRLSANLTNQTKLLVLWPDYAERPKTFTAMRLMAKENGWNVLDLSTILGTRYERLGWDSHPSASVQKIAGEAIIQAILDPIASREATDKRM